MELYNEDCLEEKRMVYPVNKYDSRHDILHIYLNKRCNEYDASAEEESPNVYVLKDDDTDEIVGFKILDFTKNVGKVSKMYPQCNFCIGQEKL